MTDDTRERARQVAHGIIESLCHDYRMDGGGDHGPTCDAVTDALVAFANAAANAENEVCEELAANLWEAAPAIAARRKERHVGT